MSHTMSKLSIHTIVAALCGSFLLTACPGDDAPSTGTETEGESSTTGPPVTTMPPTTTPPDDTTTTGATTVAVDDTSSTGPSPTTTTDETTGTESSSSGGSESSSSGGSESSSTGEPPPPGDGYGDCANFDPMVACLPDEECIGDGSGNAVCLEQGCADAGDCALPSTGNSVPTCLDVTGDGITDCYLDCSMGEACPDGMICIFDFVCIWPLQAPGGGLCPDQDLGNAVPQTVMGNNTGLADDWILSCAPGGEDAMYQFTATAAGNYTFDTVGSAIDTVLAVLEDCDGPELGCNDDAVGLTSSVTVPLAAGQTVIIVVDGFGGETGPFTLNISN
jgi:hypothetical protein